MKSKILQRTDVKLETWLRSERGEANFAREIMCLRMKKKAVCNIMCSD